ncbi:MAG: methyltransferase domain-containing protein [Verrucomicrobia bacterium]|nr:methyltransferase domain-containing protein [Verrucomicrobiota bacterium]
MKTNLPLTCPCKLKSNLLRVEGGFACQNEECEHFRPDDIFPIVNEIPVLVSEKRCDTVCDEGSDQTYIERPLSGFSRLKKMIVGESKTTKANCSLFIEELFLKNIKPKVLVIGSGEKGSGTEELWNNNEIEIHGIDIYGSSSVDVICDAHYLPLKGGYYDGVWIQAVLEHVLEPTLVVSEIHRVLRVNGLVYAETPFMQQVHEGAYDFTRFTVLGHRYLFRKFESIRMGGNQGPELVFAWATRYLIWSITRSRKIGRVFGLVVGFLLRPVAYFVSKSSMFDASSGVFFLGRKSEGNVLTHKDIIQLYAGQM